MELERRTVLLSTLSIPPISEADIVQELMGSIAMMGLLHPITITVDSRIHAGVKRAQAMQALGRESIPVCVLPADASADLIEEVGIQENLVRGNLPWYESVILKKKLFELRQKQKGVAKQGRKVGFSLRDLASELEEGLGTLSQDLRLAEAVLADPTLRTIEDKTTAQRIIFQKAKRIEAEIEASIPDRAIAFELNSVLCGNSAEILKFFPDNAFDVCFTDPPWLVYKDKELVKDESTLPVFEQVYRVLKPDSFLYVICSTPDFYTYLGELSKIGFKCQSMPLIWNKLNVVSHGLRSWEYYRDYEPILLAVKGSPVLTRSTPPSAVYTSAAVHPSRAIHPNEKPVDVPMLYLEHCSYEGSIVLDPFGGSGVTAEACIKTGRRYVTIERSKEFATGIERRLSAVLAEQNKPVV